MKLALKEFISHSAQLCLILMRKTTVLIRSVLILMLCVGLVSILPVVSASTATTQSTNEQVSITLEITDAYYCDADDDGLEDDVVGFFDITLSGQSRYTFDVYTSLTLPSGTVYSYAYVVNTRLELLHCVMYFYNHATESGDYTFSVEIVSYTGGVAYCAAEYTFDPPGGSGDADPCGSLVVTA